MVPRRVHQLLGRRYLLPLTTGATRWVELIHRSDQYFLGCYVSQDDADCLHLPQLQEALLVNNTTEKGPCLFLICKNGDFEFQADSKQLFTAWRDILLGCGVTTLTFDQLYELGRRVGEGSFAKVYIGHQMFTGEEVCVKAVDKSKVKDSNVYTEIEMLRKVFHPYIIRLFAAYEKEDTICLILEYLKGGELFDYLTKNGPYTEALAKQALRRILEGLHCMHQKGVVHRDLKTENLILEESSNPVSLKIIDFGLASTLGSSTMRMRCGSPGYVAPEILEDKPYGVKVDVFSVGVILFTILVGYPPFRGSDVKEILRKNMQCRVTFNHARWAPVSQQAMDLILWMTSKDPDRRCSAAQALTHPWFEKVPTGPHTPCVKSYIRHTGTPPHHTLTADTTASGSPTTTLVQSKLRTSTSALGLSEQFNLSANYPPNIRQQQAVHLPVSTSPVSTSPVSKSPVSKSPVSTSPVSTSPVSTSPVSTSPVSTSPVSPQRISWRPVDVTASTRYVAQSVRNTPTKQSVAGSSTAGSPAARNAQQLPARTPLKLPTATAAPQAPRRTTQTDRPLPTPAESPGNNSVKDDEAQAALRTRRRAKTGCTKMKTSDLFQSCAHKRTDNKASPGLTADTLKALGEVEGHDACRAALGWTTASVASSVAAGVPTRSATVPSRIERLAGLTASYEAVMVCEGFIGREGKRLKELHDLSSTQNTEFFEKHVEELTASAPHLPADDDSSEDEDSPSRPKYVWRKKSKDSNADKGWDRMEVTSKYFRACRYAPSRMSFASLCARQSSRHRGISFVPPPSSTGFEFSGENIRHDSRASGKTVRFARAPSEENTAASPKRADRRRIQSLPSDTDSVKNAASKAAQESAINADVTWCDAANTSNCSPVNTAAAVACSSPVNTAAAVACSTPVNTAAAVACSSPVNTAAAVACSRSQVNPSARHGAVPTREGSNMRASTKAAGPAPVHASSGVKGGINLTSRDNGQRGQSSAASGSRDAPVVRQGSTTRGGMFRLGSGSRNAQTSTQTGSSCSSMVVNGQSGAAPCSPVVSVKKQPFLQTLRDGVFSVKASIARVTDRRESQDVPPADQQGARLIKKAGRATKKPASVAKPEE